ncbi:nitroreductase [Candidatus Heimdallarchaeota archaeon]|nr:MAG: nitroreductase [Candidatus Heimdallarchaeota archaeon]
MTNIDSMNFTELVSKRRAYRKLKPFDINADLLQELLKITSLAPSCENNQPWRFVFVYNDEQLQSMYKVFPNKNKWVENASLIVGVFSKQELDCSIDDRDYYLFDTGIAVAYLMLRATEMGLVAHPTSYYDEGEAKKIMGIPEDMQLITIIAIGKHEDTKKIELSPEQEEAELVRPKRFSIQYLNYLGNYVEEYEENKKRFERVFD